MKSNTTVAALASPPGVGAIALIRLTGPDACTLIETLFRSPHPKPLPVRRALFGSIVFMGETLDSGILTLYSNPHSYTGENMAEFSCHGSPFIASRILDALLKSGAKPAEPGEFTRRAFLNGKMDLVQAEAVAALIRSDTDKAATAAKQQLEGKLSTEFKSFQTALVQKLSLIESQIDFAEEETTLFNPETLKEELSKLSSRMQELLSSYNQGRIVAGEFRVALIGSPNAGKSSLFNALCGSERVIVDEHPGTTRDLIEETISLGGFRITLIDTAGLRETDNRVEQIGIARARQAAADADLALIVLDATDGTLSSDLQTYSKLKPDGQLAVLNKADLAPSTLPIVNGLPISALTGLGLNELKSAILQAIPKASSESEGLLITNLRQKGALQEAILAIKPLTVSATLGEEILAQHLRDALRALESITGQVTDDDILNNIFSTFCIGK